MLKLKLIIKNIFSNRDVLLFIPIVNIINIHKNYYLKLLCQFIIGLYFKNA